MKVIDMKGSTKFWIALGLLVYVAGWVIISQGDKIIKDYEGFVVLQVTWISAIVLFVMWDLCSPTSWIWKEVKKLNKLLDKHLTD